MASHNAKEGTLGGTKTTSSKEIISDTRAISFLEIPFGMITHTTIMAIRTTDIMTIMRRDYFETITAMQKELTQLGYYHGPVDGLIGSGNGSGDSVVPICRQASRYRSDRRSDIESAEDQLEINSSIDR